MSDESNCESLAAIRLTLLLVENSRVRFGSTRYKKAWRSDIGIIGSVQQGKIPYP